MVDKPLFRLLCLCFALGALSWGILIWNMAMAAKTPPEPSPFLFIVSPLVNFAALLGAVMLAKRLNRNAWVWGFSCLFLPGVFAIVLALLGRAAQPFRFETSSPRSSGSDFGFSTGNKQCGRCGRSVPLSSKSGQRCPYCGAHWSFEETRRL